MDSTQITRRNLMLKAMLGLGALPVVRVMADEIVAKEPADGMDGSVAAVEGVISNNHRHAAILGAELFLIQLNIQGEGSHPHVVTLTLEELIDIRDGKTVVITSSTVGGHAHEVVFNG